ncbi:putative serine/threonine-protein kinase nek3 [Capsicum chacoense]
MQMAPTTYPSDSKNSTQCPTPTNPSTIHKLGNPQTNLNISLHEATSAKPTCTPFNPHNNNTTLKPNSIHSSSTSSSTKHTTIKSTNINSPRATLNPSKSVDFFPNLSNPPCANSITTNLEEMPKKPKTPETTTSIIKATTVPMEPTVTYTITQDNFLEIIQHNLPSAQNAKEIPKKEQTFQQHSKVSHEKQQHARPTMGCRNQPLEYFQPKSSANTPNLSNNTNLPVELEHLDTTKPNSNHNISRSIRRDATDDEHTMLEIVQSYQNLLHARFIQNQHFIEIGRNMIYLQANNMVTQMEILNSFSYQLTNYSDWSMPHLPDTLEDTYSHDQVVPQINETRTWTNPSSPM